MLRIIMFLLVAVVAWSSPAGANGTREDAMAMVKRVQEMFRKQGTGGYVPRRYRQIHGSVPRRRALSVRLRSEGRVRGPRRT